MRCHCSKFGFKKLTSSKATGWLARITFPCLPKFYDQCGVGLGQLQTSDHRFGSISALIRTPVKIDTNAKLTLFSMGGGAIMASLQFFLNISRTT